MAQLLRPGAKGGGVTHRNRRGADCKLQHFTEAISSRRINVPKQGRRHSVSFLGVAASAVPSMLQAPRDHVFVWTAGIEGKYYVGVYQ
jgi:hypothetical protein